MAFVPARLALGPDFELERAAPTSCVRRPRPAVRCGATPFHAEPLTSEERAASHAALGPKPSYEEIDRSPLNRLFMGVFKRCLREEYERDGRQAGNQKEGFDEVVNLTMKLKRKYSGDDAELTEAAQRVLLALFPPGMLPAFRAMFSRPFPEFSSWLNAQVTSKATLWLMGRNEILDDGVTVKVERCRFLEESGCLGVCANACKRPTEKLFKEDMEIDLWIEPNPDDFSCQFHFGSKPPPEGEDTLFKQPCFTSCPTARKLDQACNVVE